MLSKKIYKETFVCMRACVCGCGAVKKLKMKEHSRSDCSRMLRGRANAGCIWMHYGIIRNGNRQRRHTRQDGKHHNCLRIHRDDEDKRAQAAHLQDSLQHAVHQGSVGGPWVAVARCIQALPQADDKGECLRDENGEREAQDGGSKPCRLVVGRAELAGILQVMAHGQECEFANNVSSKNDDEENEGERK